jgi:hypothetical protein
MIPQYAVSHEPVMKKLILFFLLLILITFSNLYSQVSQSWIKYYNDTITVNDNFNYSKVIASDELSNVYVSGTFFSDDIYYIENKMVTIKYSPEGNIIWKASYPQYYEFGYASPYDIKLDKEGNIYICAAYRSSAQASDYLTMKYNKNGQLLWANVFDGFVHYVDVPYSIDFDANGNVYVTGKSIGYTYNSYDFLTIKYSSDGVQQWFSYFNGEDSREDIAVSVKSDKYGNVYVGGTVTDSSFNSDFCIVKYNSSGVKQWDILYDYGYDVMTDMKLDSLGKIYACGMTSENGVYYFAAVKFDEMGFMKWQRQMGGKDSLHIHNEPYAMDLDNSGNVYIAGISEKNWDTSDYAAVKYNSDGVEKWRRYYDSPSGRLDIATDIKADKYGNCYITGITHGALYSFNVTTIKIRYDGSLKWVQTVENCLDPLQYEYPVVTVSPMNDVYTAATMYPPGVNRIDLMTVKYRQDIDSNSINPVIPTSFLLKQNFPNPFNPFTNIVFDVPSSSYVTIRVYNLQGREVDRLANTFYDKGEYSIKWTPENLSSGVYFYKIEARETESSSVMFKDSKKMVLIK